MEDLSVYKHYLLRKGIRPVSVESSAYYLTHLYKNTQSLKIMDIEAFLYRLYASGRSPTYLNKFIAALRNYGEFTQNPAYKNLKYFKTHETHKGTLSDSEIERFLAIQPKDIPGVQKEVFKQFTVFFTILAYTGMRPSEVIRLSVTQVDFGVGVITLFNDTKTSTPRTVPLNPILIPVLEQYIATLDTPRLFPDWDRHKWKKQFNMRLQFLGIKREKLSTYSLRHSLITRLIEEDVALQKVMKIAGHRRIETTFHYTHLTKRDVVQAIKKDRLGRKGLTPVERLLQARKALEDLGFIVTTSKPYNKGFLLECLEGEITQVLLFINTVFLCRYYYI